MTADTMLIAAIVAAFVLALALGYVASASASHPWWAI